MRRDPLTLWAGAVVFARAYRVPSATAGVLGLSAAMTFVKGHLIGLGGGVPIRSMWFLLLGVTVFACLPLTEAFGGLDRTFVRSRQGRTARGLWHACTTAVVAMYAYFLSVDMGLTLWFVGLSAAALGWSVISPDTCVLFLLAVGGGTILVDHTLPNYPVSDSLGGLGLVPAAITYTSALALYVLLSDAVALRRRRRAGP